MGYRRSPNPQYQVKRPNPKLRVEKRYQVCVGTDRGTWKVLSQHKKEENAIKRLISLKKKGEDATIFEIIGVF